METDRQSCPDENTLLDFVAGHGAADDRERLQRHVNGCDDCQELLGRLMAVDSGAAETSDDSTPPKSADRELPQGTRVGRYLVLHPLGEGGMGRVLAAYDPELDRKVALKLLLAEANASDPSDPAPARLLREAQAMARLAHPNVNAVFDVGTFGEGVFIAMELVEGRDLRQWLHQRRRPWREVLAALREAGRGLAAAHAAGLIHRDVKPDNILVGNDGRVRVTDFGLAAVSGAGDPVSQGREDSTLGSASLTALATPLTRPGTLVGTPGYMAPELRRRTLADARSDQFAFCVTLYEALYGQRPFDRDPQQDWARGEDPRPREAPKGSKVPGWLRAVVLRGLASDPAARYPSMDALLRELGRDPGLRRRRYAAAAAAVLLAAWGVASYRQLATREARVCQGSGQRLKGVWDDDARRAVRAAFEATRQSYALDAWRGVERALDAYTAAWVSMDVAACEAARQGDEVSELPALQRVCLGHRLVEVRALAGVLAKADAQVVSKAVEAAQALTPLARCADAESLLAPVKPPRDEATRAKVEELRERLAEVQALRDTGKYQAGLEAIAPLVEAARALQYAPLEAQVLFQKGDLQGLSGKIKESKATMVEAELAAEAGRNELVAAESAIQLAHLCYMLGERDPMLAWQRRARAYLARLGGDAYTESQLLLHMGMVAGHDGQGGEAVSLMSRGLKLREGLYGPEHPKTLQAMVRLGTALWTDGRYAEALETLRRALSAHERVLGPEHPRTLDVLVLLGALLAEQGGQYERAQPMVERALELRLKELGPDHYQVASTMWALAQIHHGLGNYEQATRLFRRAREIYVKVYGSEHGQVARMLVNEADMLREQQRYREARGAVRRALAILSRDKDVDWVVNALCTLAALHRDQGKHGEALAAYRRAAEFREKLAGPDNLSLSFPLSGMGEAYAGMRQFAPAIPLLRRALQLREGKTVPREADADTRFALAQALWETKTDRAQAVQLAREAADAYASLPRRKPKERARVEAWLRSHTAP